MNMTKTETIFNLDGNLITFSFNEQKITLLFSDGNI